VSGTASKPQAAGKSIRRGARRRSRRPEVSGTASRPPPAGNSICRGA